MLVREKILWGISKRWPQDEAQEFLRYRVEVDDVVVAMDRPWVPAGLKFARIRSSDPDALLVQRVARLRATDVLDRRFLYYVIASPEFVDYVKNVGRGVAVATHQREADWRTCLPASASCRATTNRRCTFCLRRFDRQQ